MNLESFIFENVLDIMPFDVYVVDITNYTIIFMNKYMKERYGDLSGGTCHKLLFSQEDTPCVHCKISELIDTDSKPNQNTATFDFFNDSDQNWYQLIEKAIYWTDGRIVKYSIGVDISQLKEVQNTLAEAHAELALKNKKLQETSIRDILTGLYNRYMMDEELDKHILSDAFAIAMIEIDGLKTINDQHGYQIGDHIIVQVSEILKKHFTAPCVLGRGAGESFLIIRPNATIYELQTQSEKCRNEISQSLFPIISTVTCSFGLSNKFPEETKKTILQRCDRALIEARSKMGNRVEICLTNHDRS